MTTFKSQATQKSEEKEFVPVRAQNIGGSRHAETFLKENKLEKNKYTVEVLREPGSTLTGENIRNILLDKGTDISDKTELLLMFAARAEMIKEHLAKANEDIVLCDRYYHASIAYQGYGRKLPLDLIDSLIININCPIPDLTIIYDLDVNLGFKRKAKDDIDRIESSGINFFEDVRKGYQQIANEREEVVILDASESIEILNQQTKDLIEPLI